MARPVSKNYQDKQKFILDNAVKLFSEKSYAGTSMQEIAKACNMSKPLLYHYYLDKQALLFGAANYYIDELLMLMASVKHKDCSPEHIFRELIHLFMHKYQSAQNYHVVLIQDIKFLDESHQQAIIIKERALVFEFSGIIAPLNAELAKTILLKPITMTLFGMINWTFTWFDQAGKIDHSGMADLICDLFLKGITQIKPI